MWLTMATVAVWLTTTTTALQCVAVLLTMATVLKSLLTPIVLPQSSTSALQCVVLQCVVLQCVAISGLTTERKRLAVF